MLYTEFSSDMWFWLVGAVSSLIFATIIAMRLKGTSEYIKYSSLLIVGIMSATATSYLLWLVPLFFTRNADIYQYFFIAGFVFSHLSLVFIGLLLYFLTLLNRQKTKIALGIITAIIGLVSIILHTESLLGSVELQGSEVIYEVSVASSVLLSVLFTPLAGLGIFLIKRGVSSKILATKTKAISLGLTIFLLAISLALASLSAATQSGADDEPFSGISIYYYLYFLVLNIVLVALRYFNKKRSSLK